MNILDNFLEELNNSENEFINESELNIKNAVTNHNIQVSRTKRKKAELEKYKAMKKATVDPVRAKLIDKKIQYLTVELKNIDTNRANALNAKRAIQNQEEIADNNLNAEMVTLDTEISDFIYENFGSFDYFLQNTFTLLEGINLFNYIRPFDERIVAEKYIKNINTNFDHSIIESNNYLNKYIKSNKMLNEDNTTLDTKSSFADVYDAYGNNEIQSNNVNVLTCDELERCPINTIMNILIQDSDLLNIVISNIASNNNLSYYSKQINNCNNNSKLYIARNVLSNNDNYKIRKAFIDKIVQRQRLFDNPIMTKLEYKSNIDNAIINNINVTNESIKFISELFNVNEDFGGATSELKYRLGPSLTYKYDISRNNLSTRLDKSHSHAHAESVLYSGVTGAIIEYIQTGKFTSKTIDFNDYKYVTDKIKNNNDIRYYIRTITMELNRVSPDIDKLLSLKTKIRQAYNTAAKQI